jgi:hypothetical protein
MRVQDEGARDLAKIRSIQLALDRNLRDYELITLWRGSTHPPTS